MFITCSRCKESKEKETCYQFIKSENRHRTVCRKCRSSDQIKRKIERKVSDDLFYWRTRAYSFNQTSNRAKSISNIVREKIKYLDLKRLYEENPKCHYCNIKLNKEDAEFDHSIPISKCGAHKIDNIKICCHDCNQLKGIKTEVEFRVFIKEYSKRFNVGASV